MGRITFIGDVHGKTDQYQKMLQRRFDGQTTFQVGDMGVGFANQRGNFDEHGGLRPEIMSRGRHLWIRGNHDNPEVCRRQGDRGYAGDYGYIEDLELFFLGGAHSVDYQWRTPGRSWWEEEQLSYPELGKAFDLYLEKKPKYVATHDAPTAAVTWLLTSCNFRLYKLESAHQRTSLALQQMFDMHKPVEWVFGHYHISQSFDWQGTKFTCVNELDTYTIGESPIIETT
jgi:hypothetical protein